MTTALSWLKDNSDAVPTASELVELLTKFREGKLAASKSRTYRAPSPSGPWSSDSDTSETPRQPRRVAGEMSPKASVTPDRSSTKRKTPPVTPADWAGRDINPATRLPYGTYGLFYGINYNESDDSSDEEELARIKKAEQEKERRLQRDNLAQLRRSAHTSLAQPPNMSPIAEESHDVTAVVDTIPIHEIDALEKVLRPSAPSRLNNNTKVDNNIDSTSKIDNNIGTPNRVDKSINPTNQIDNTANTSFTETSPQIEVIPRAPRTPRPIAEPRPHKTPQLKKLFDRKLFNASQPNASSSNASASNASASNASASNASASNASAANASDPNASQPNASASNDTAPDASALNASAPNAFASIASAPIASAPNTFQPNASQPTAALSELRSAATFSKSGPASAVDTLQSSTSSQTLSTLPEFEISVEIQNIVDAIPDEAYEALDDFTRAEFDFVISDEIMAVVNAIPDNEFDFTVSDEVMTLVDSIPDNEFDGMDLDLSYEM